MFARWPEAGRVKTRLFAALPAAQALVLYRGMLADAITAAERAAAERRRVYWADEPPESSPPHRWEWRAQRGADLGARLDAASTELLRDSGDRVVIIGADCPELGADVIHRAFDVLERADVGVAPARDGGYALIALARPVPLFDRIPWGTDEVLMRTLDRAREQGVTVEVLETFDDVDRPEDVVGLIARLAASRDGATHTRVALRELRLLP